jgi:hypothetical protein
LSSLIHGGLDALDEIFVGGFDGNDFFVEAVNGEAVKRFTKERKSSPDGEADVSDVRLKSNVPFE